MWLTRWPACSHRASAPSQLRWSRVRVRSDKRIEDVNEAEVKQRGRRAHTRATANVELTTVIGELRDNSAWLHKAACLQVLYTSWHVLMFLWIHPSICVHIYDDTNLYICLFTLYLHWYIGKIKNLIRFNRPLYEITFIQLTLMITCNSRIKKNMICPKKGYIWLKMIMKSIKFNSLIPLIKTYCTCRFNCSWVDWRLA